MSYTNGLDNPELYMQVKLYTGNGSSQAITLDGDENMQPDFIWFKNRTSAQSHCLVNSVTGRKGLLSDSTSAEMTFDSTKDFTSFDSDGFTVGIPHQVNSLNYNTGSIVAWNWKGGGSGSSNSDGSISSTVSANTDAGFSIVSWSGNGSTATIGHGLNATPKVIIFKSRTNATYAWFVGHQSLDANPWTKYMTLENNNAINDDLIWNDTAPTSNVFSVGSYVSTNGSGQNFIGYCFAEKQGYSKFGSYTGNGNADGPYIHLGFRPAWVMFKKSSSTSSWWIGDSKRDVDNVVQQELYADTNSAENTESGGRVDFLSNGFKHRNSGGSGNTSGATYIYMAFAEAPFVNSNGVPCNAR